MRRDRFIRSTPNPGSLAASDQGSHVPTPPRGGNGDFAARHFELHQLFCLAYRCGEISGPTKGLSPNDGGAPGVGRRRDSGICAKLLRAAAAPMKPADVRVKYCLRDFPIAPPEPTIATSESQPPSASLDRRRAKRGAVGLSVGSVPAKRRCERCGPAWFFGTKRTDACSCFRFEISAGDQSLSKDAIVSPHRRLRLMKHRRSQTHHQRFA